MIKRGLIFNENGLDLPDHAHKLCLTAAKYASHPYPLFCNGWFVIRALFRQGQLHADALNVARELIVIALASMFQFEIPNVPCHQQVQIISACALNYSSL